MAAPAITQVLDAIVKKVEAIDPSIDPGSRFKRSSETVPPTTRNRRTFNLDFMGQPQDLSAAGSGTQTVGQADVVAEFQLRIAYPIARNERNLETLLAADSELVRRALSRSANWTGTTVRTMRSFRSSVDWSERTTPAGQPGTVRLVVKATFLYRELEQ